MGLRSLGNSHNLSQIALSLFCVRVELNLVMASDNLTNVENLLDLYSVSIQENQPSMIELFEHILKSECLRRTIPLDSERA